MALCRFGPDSDVYIFYDVSGGISCCGCSFEGRGTFNVSTEQEMLAHLEKHRGAGHKVPDEAFTDLAEER